MARNSPKTMTPSLSPSPGAMVMAPSFFSARRDRSNAATSPVTAPINVPIYNRTAFFHRSPILPKNAFIFSMKPSKVNDGFYNHVSTANNITACDINIILRHACVVRQIRQCVYHQVNETDENGKNISAVTIMGIVSQIVEISAQRAISPVELRGGNADQNRYTDKQHRANHHRQNDLRSALLAVR